eukprot:CAMPEP_0185743526 /NCGR_PEP_ID=MMETSP1174-20130828/1330_1 /TAXON_ID=35687 /ORGANISM="Dictyocha speculum, Strain CCMP1381" /LENGTH=57 /DNA_ID=CAMNT_0028416305 /DNA_START=39 /DNA_END=209 /DNA_ORIENTATION=+
MTALAEQTVVAQELFKKIGGTDNEGVVAEVLDLVKSAGLKALTQSGGMETLKSNLEN